MARKSLFERRDQLYSLRSGRREVAVNTTKHDDALLAAKAAGDFLLQVHHPKISLRLTVIKGNCEIEEEPEDCLFAHREAIQQIAMPFRVSRNWYPGSAWQRRITQKGAWHLLSLYTSDTKSDNQRH